MSAWVRSSIQEYAPGQRWCSRATRDSGARDACRAGAAVPRRLELQFTPDQNAEVLRLQAGADRRDDGPGALRRSGLAAGSGQARARSRSTSAGVSIAPDMLWFNLNPAAKSAHGRPWLQRDELRHAISARSTARRSSIRCFSARPWRSPARSRRATASGSLPDLPRPGVRSRAGRKRLAAIGLKDRNGDGLLDDERGQDGVVCDAHDQGQHRSGTVGRDHSRSNCARSG